MGEAILVGIFTLLGFLLGAAIAGTSAKKSTE